MKTKADQTSLVKKLVEIRSELGPVQKTKRNPHFNYNYVGEAQITAIIGPRFDEHGILFTTSVKSMDVHHGQAKEGITVAVTTEHKIIDTDSKEEMIIYGAGVGWDSGDKGVYKAITGAVKYALMKMFLVTDEQDPEAGEQRAAPEPGRTGHRRTKPYEETKPEEAGPKASHDLLELKSFLTENKIPDAFLIALLQEKKLIEPQVKNLSSVQPGILRRVLDDKSKANLIKAWAAQQADEDSGSATAPMSQRVSKPQEAATPRGGRKTASREPEDEDQRRERKPVMDDIEPADYLEQEGFKNWRKVPIHFGNDKGKTLGTVSKKSLSWFLYTWTPKPYKGVWQDNDVLLDMACCLAVAELGDE